MRNTYVIENDVINLFTHASFPAKPCFQIKSDLLG